MTVVVTVVLFLLFKVSFSTDEAGTVSGTAEALNGVSAQCGDELTVVAAVHYPVSKIAFLYLYSFTQY